MDKQINRRDFIKKSTTAYAGISFLPYLYQKSAASDRLRIAHIGLGGMGNNHLNWFAQIPEVDIVALCDVDKSHLNQSLKSLEKLKSKGKVVGYEDFRNILDRKDIDAITYATPDHWHAQIAILAFQAGKDVYGEKPLSFDIKEGQLMLNNLNQFDRIFQLGTQIHAGDNYHRVVELLRSGILGKIDTVRLWKTGFSPGLGYPKIQKPPKDLNWDMWLGPAPWSDYVPERCHKTYRYFLDYSGGVYADFWCHIADIVFWALQPQGLKSVVARGEKPDGIADAPKWLDVDFEFEDLNLSWTTQPPNVPGASERGIGAYFEGEKGTLICDYETREITINGETYTNLPEIPISIPRSPGHQQNFIDSVKSRKQPESNLDYVRSMTLPMHLGLISWQVGHKLNWDSVNESFINDEEANQFLNRSNRTKWDLIKK
jgi:predicted dehydrogenase